MKRTLAVVPALLLVLWFASTNPSTIEAGFVQTGVTGTAMDSYTFVQVAVPRDLTTACSNTEAAAQTCLMLGAMVDLNKPEVDNVLVIFHQVITRNGKVIFDYRKANPRL